MPVFEIRYQGENIASKVFRSNFYVVKFLEKDDLYWEADEEQALSKKGGEIHIWVQNASKSPLISFVRPDWQLIVDGVSFERNFHTEIDVDGRTVELQYGEYCFLCAFQ